MANIGRVLMLQYCFMAVIVLCVLGMCLLINTETNTPRYMYNSSINVQRYRFRQFTPGYKVIVLWTPADDLWQWIFPDGNRTINACEEQRCYITSNRNRAKEASLVLIHVREFYNQFNMELPTERYDHQRFVFMSIESPTRLHYYQLFNQFGPGPKFSSFDGIFNLTATYLPESDIYIPYNAANAIQKSIDPDSNALGTQALTNITGMKTGLVLWYVSYCWNWQTEKRRSYVRELQEFVHIDIYGLCGQPDPCIGYGNHTCNQNMLKSYKFYLAFENSQCRHYISEKFWKCLKHGTLPIVLGGPIKDYLAVAPPNSFLHVDNFTSPEELSRWILYLDSNDKAYESYFEWRTVLDIGLKPQQQLLCNLCKTAHETPERSKSYNITEWFSQDKLCKV